MDKSENINELAAALAKAQGEIEGAHKDSANPFFRSKYADLASVWDACRGPLSKHGLSIIQLPRAEGSMVTMTTVLMHSSGQWIGGDLTATAKDDGPQAIGSVMTYLRRYMLQALVGVAPDDDDGNAAEGRTQPAGKADASVNLPSSPAASPKAKTAAKKVAQEHGLKTGDEIGKPTKSTYDTAIELIDRANSFELLDTCYAWLLKQYEKKLANGKPALLTHKQLLELMDRIINRAIECVHFQSDVALAKAFIDRFRGYDGITEQEQMAYWESLGKVEEAVLLDREAAGATT